MDYQDVGIMTVELSGLHGLWSTRKESNLHSRKKWILSPSCLPISPRVDMQLRGDVELQLDPEGVYIPLRKSIPDLLGM